MRFSANPDHTCPAGDFGNHLVLIDRTGQQASPRVLCQQHTAWHAQGAHRHPTWSWDGTRILYASHCGDRINTYPVRP